MHKTNTPVYKTKRFTESRNNQTPSNFDTLKHKTNIKIYIIPL